MIQSITVTGMTCQNCVRHVTGALGQLPGVRSVEVQLQDGLARLVVEHEVPAELISAALDEAGYALA